MCVCACVLSVCAFVCVHLRVLARMGGFCDYVCVIVGLCIYAFEFLCGRVFVCVSVCVSVCSND